MPGTLVLFVLVFISSLPVIAVFFWFKLSKYEFTIFCFLFALLAGAASFFPALLFQEILNMTFHSNRLNLFFHHFIRIAFTEELSRFLLLLIYFWINDRILQRISGQYTRCNSIGINYEKKATATGLIAGFGFALLENATYAASDINLLPLRIILTSAIHGACGSRIGTATFLIRSNPIKAILNVIAATAIHGIYNLMVIMPGIAPIMAILVAISALFTSILTIRYSSS
ncbi:MAG: PrsW family intramembrane metalloprotease [Oscillospiraceae bacterium]|jgi:RsiW-degrading membrane proteinase PrsW (M82 family)|nr:PrsW family intramembrane metalloprotease [Oscillospiraceae bacterium]